MQVVTMVGFCELSVGACELTFGKLTVGGWLSASYYTDSTANGFWLV
ncbi:MAG: hypothetical protein RIS47_1883 [Bacteroidota bacterium]